MTMEKIWLSKQEPFHSTTSAFSEIADAFQVTFLISPMVLAS